MNRREEIRRQLMITFQGELEEHLGTLNRNLLVLEKSTSLQGNETLLVESLRAAHSLKGAARAVDLGDIEQIAHRLEDIFTALQRQELAFQASLFDLIFPALDSLRAAMAAYVRGERLPVEERQNLIDRLQAASGKTPPAMPPTLPAGADIPPSSADRSSDSPDILETPTASSPLPAGLSVPAPQPMIVPAAPSGLRHDDRSADSRTVRITVEKLDALMADMGELAALRLRTEQRLNEMQAIQRQFLRWRKSRHKIRGPLSHVQHHVARPGADESSTTTLNPAELLPILDFVGRSEEQFQALKIQLDHLASNLTSDYHRLSLQIDDLQDRVRRVRMLPIATLFNPFARMVRDLGRQQNKDILLIVEGADTEIDRQVLEKIKDPLTHLLRNAVDHGIEPAAIRRERGKPLQGLIRLSAVQRGNRISLQVSDDGGGLDLPALRQAAVTQGLLSAQAAASLDDQQAAQLIFQAGLSTAQKVTDLSGRGLGMDIVRQNLEDLHGIIEVDPGPGRGTTITLHLPLTLATTHVLLIKAAHLLLALPTVNVERILRIQLAQIGSLSGRPAIQVEGRLAPLVSLTQVLGLPESQTAFEPDQKIPVVVLGAAEKRVAFWVDALLGTQEVVIKNLGFPLQRVRNVAGASILGSGQILMVLNVIDLIKSVQTHSAAPRLSPVEKLKTSRHRLLVVDDSITTRTLEKNILENAGYQVAVAVDGQEAWDLLQNTPLEAVISDISMPEMDGFALTEKIKQNEVTRHLPVILVTSLEDAQHKLRGLEAGADAYLVKSSFDHQELLDTLQRLIG